MATREQRQAGRNGFRVHQNRDDEGGKVVSLGARRRRDRRTDPDWMRKVRDYILWRTTREMNRDHSLIQYASDVLIVTRQFDHEGKVELLYRKKEAVKAWYENRIVRFPKITPTGRISSEEKNPVDIWMQHKKRSSLKGIVNAPGLFLDKDWMNVWTGWGTQPKMVPARDKDTGEIIYDAKGNAEMVYDFSGEGCRLILQHVYEVLACGDQRKARWVLAWWADILQNPRSKKPTGLMIYGGQGAGKSFLTDHLWPKILGTAFSAERDTKFLKEDAGNSTAAGKLLIVAEEAIFSGDPRMAAELKTFISQPKVGVRSLYKDKIIVDNTARLEGHMNPQSSGGHVVALENDDRRWTVIECANHRVGDKKYFNALKHEIENGGAEAFHAYLLNPAIFDGVDLQIGLQTSATIEQKVLSLPHQEAFLHECMRSASVQLALAEAAREPWQGEMKVDQADLFKSYLDWCKAHKRDYPGTIVQFNKKLRTVMGLDPDKDIGRYNNGGRYWKFPTLEGARRQFQTWIKCPEEPESLSKLWDDYVQPEAMEADEHAAMWQPSMPTAQMPPVRPARPETKPAKPLDWKQAAKVREYEDWKAGRDTVPASIDAIVDAAEDVHAPPF